MKTKLLFLITLVISFVQFSKAQCSVSANSFGNNTIFGYDISGEVIVTLNNNNTITLDLGTDFSTADGPDLRAYLVDSDGMSNVQLQNANISSLNNIEFGLVSCTGCSPVINASEDKSFTVPIPTGKDITDFDKVFFYCLQFNAFWDFGSFTRFTSTNCSILNIEDTTFENFSLYPNPSNGKVTLQAQNNNKAQISVYNILGSQVYATYQDLNSELDLSALESGAYLVRVETEGEQTIKRLIIE